MSESRNILKVSAVGFGDFLYHAMVKRKLRNPSASTGERSVGRLVGRKSQVAIFEYGSRLLRCEPVGDKKRGDTLYRDTQNRHQFNPDTRLALLKNSSSEYL